MRASGRYLVATLIVATGAAVFAVLFRASLAWVYRTVYGASGVVEAITSLPGWWRLLIPTLAGLAAGLVTRMRRAPSQNVSNWCRAGWGVSPSTRRNLASAAWGGISRWKVGG